MRSVWSIARPRLSFRVRQYGTARYMGRHASSSKVAGAAAKQETRPGTNPRQRVGCATSLASNLIHSTPPLLLLLCYHDRGELLLCPPASPQLPTHCHQAAANNLVCPTASYRLSNSAACTYTCTHTFADHCCSAMMADVRSWATHMTTPQCKCNSTPRMRMRASLSSIDSSGRSALPARGWRRPRAIRPFPAQASSGQAKPNQTCTGGCPVCKWPPNMTLTTITTTNEALETACGMLIGDDPEYHGTAAESGSSPAV